MHGCIRLASFRGPWHAYVAIRIGPPVSSATGVYSKKMPGRKNRPDYFATVPETAPGRPGQAAPRIPIIVTVVSRHVVQLQPLAERLGE